MLSVWMDGCMQVALQQTGKPWKAMTDFHETWYVGSGRHRYYPSGVSLPSAHIK